MSLISAYIYSTNLKFQKNIEHFTEFHMKRFSFPFPAPFSEADTQYTKSNWNLKLISYIKKIVWLSLDLIFLYKNVPNKMCDTSTLLWKRTSTNEVQMSTECTKKFSEKDEKGMKFPLAHLIAAFPRSYGISIEKLYKNTTHTSEFGGKKWMTHAIHVEFLFLDYAGGKEENRKHWNHRWIAAECQQSARRGRKNTEKT